MVTRYNVITVDSEQAKNSKYLALRQISKVVDPFAPETTQIIEGLFECLEGGEIKGVGLAAPQVGILARIFVVNIPELRKKKFEGEQTDIADPDEVAIEYKFPMRMAVVNPVFEELSLEKDNDYEGCLSIPGLMGVVPRHKRLRVTGYDEKCMPIDMIIDGFIARVFQHEYDHLEGLLYIDRMEAPHVLEAVDTNVPLQSEEITMPDEEQNNSKTEN